MKRCPVLIFSHGLGTAKEIYTAQLEDLASHDYVVAAITHTYEAILTVFPDGRHVVFDRARWKVPSTAEANADQQHCLDVTLGDFAPAKRDHLIERRLRVAHAASRAAGDGCQGRIPDLNFLLAGNQPQPFAPISGHLPRLGPDPIDRSEQLRIPSREGREPMESRRPKWNRPSFQQCPPAPGAGA